jgi:integrase
MPRRMLTEALCEKVKPPAAGREEWFDQAGGGLALRVTAAGHRSWRLHYRFGGTPRTYTIGSYPAIKLAQARRLAGAALERLHNGVDLSAEKRAQREAGPPDRDTFAAVARDYLDQHARPNTGAGTYKETARVLERDVIPKWRIRAIAEITRGDVNKLVDAKVAGSPVQANKTLVHVRKVFNWAVAKGRLASSPAAGVEPPTKERARDRALTDDELRWLWAACDEIGWPFGPLVKLLALTAQRREEVAGMRWAELDLDGALWTIPRERAKNDRAHLVHLSAPAIAVLRTLPRDAPGEELVFTVTGKTVVSGFSRAKRRLDAAMLRARRRAFGLPEDETALRKALKLAAGQSLHAEVPGWTIHDLRRTAATGMARLNIPPHVVDKVLNHVSGTIRGVAAVYNRFEYLEERRKALEAWGGYVSDLIMPTRPNVVQLRAAKLADA